MDRKKMGRYVTLYALLAGWFSVSTTARPRPGSDTLTRATAPVFVQTAFLIPLQEVGAQVALSALVSQTEKRIVRQSGWEKVIVKDRILSVMPGFYYQRYLHTNLFLTVDYAFVRRHRSGFYRTFAPFVGVSRTFLNAATYTVDDAGTVTRAKRAGDWRAMAGFRWGIGKRFDTKKPRVLRDIFLTANVPFFYPNFRSVALKPTLQLGAAFNLNRFRRSYTRTTKTVRR